MAPAGQTPTGAFGGYISLLGSAAFLSAIDSRHVANFWKVHVIMQQPTEAAVS